MLNEVRSGENGRRGEEVRQSFSNLCLSLSYHYYDLFLLLL